MREARLTRYWFVSRSLMLLWLLLSLWQIGAFPFAEGDAEATNALRGMYLALTTSDPVAAGGLFAQGYSPLAYLPTTLGAHLLSVNDFTLRLPYALIGAAQMPLLLAIVNRSFGRRAAAFAGLMLLGSGLFAINRLATGVSVFMAFELAGALFLLRYVDDRRSRWLILSSSLFALATLVVPTGVFLLVTGLVIGWRAHKARREAMIAVLAGGGPLLVFVIVASLLGGVYSGMTGSPVYQSAESGLFGAMSFPGSSPTSVLDAWLVYVGVPVTLLVQIGVVEALFHNRAARVYVAVLLSLATVQTLFTMAVSDNSESLVTTAPLFVGVAAFGWSRLISQLRSVAAQAMVAMAVAAVAMAGVAWQQAVFNPQTEFTAGLQPLREYALSLDHGRGLFADSPEGMRAIAVILREETEAGERILVRDGVSSAAIELYSGRRVEPLDLGSLNNGGADLDGATLVIRGEDDAFNGGLSGAVNVVANHRVFSDGAVHFQLVQFSADGEPFERPIWWRSASTGSRLFSENSDYRDFVVTGG